MFLGYRNMSLIQDLSIVNQDIKQFDIVLCKFYFSDISKSKNRPVLVFKDNLPFCNYFRC